jgi:hypothetical protein
MWLVCEGKQAIAVKRDLIRSHTLSMVADL